VASSAEPWLTDRPAEDMTGARIILRRWSTGDTDELVEAVNDTLDELRPWMPWAQQPSTPEGMAVVVAEAHSAWVEGREFQFVIREDHGQHALVGCCGLHNRVGVGALEIGYWVRAGHTGQGIATEAARLLTRSAVALDGVERVEIRCDEANVRSSAIPPKVGFRLERVERRPPDAPGETDHHMVWVRGDGGSEEGRGPSTA
jgi:RimJ/RimL family protein N-acetyltransferase